MHRRKRRARLDASPRSTVELCRLLQRQGRAKASCDVARDGLSRFPNSVELREILHQTWQHTSKKELEELQGRVSAEPSVKNYMALVEHLKHYGENGRAAEVCVQMLEAHPSDADAALIGGQVLLARFHRDHVAQDGKLGLKSLQRAAELGEASFDAHFELAQTYYYIGAVSKALFWLYKALDERSDHEDANRLYRILVRLPLESQEESELLREIEENDEAHFSYEPDGEDEPATPGSFAQGLEQLSLLADVRRVVISHRGLDAVAQGGHLLDDSIDDESRCLFELAKGFRRTASMSAKRMGIGAFEEARLAWEGGTMLAFGAGRTILMLEVGGTQRLQTISGEARNFLAASAASAPTQNVGRRHA